MSGTCSSRAWLSAFLIGLSLGCSRGPDPVPLHPDLPGPLRAFILRGLPGWFTAGRGGLVAAAADPDVPARMLEDVEHLLTLYRSWFPDAPPTLTLFILTASESEWQQLADREGLRPDGIAFHAPGLLVLKNDEAQSLRPDRLPHELLHAVLFEQFGSSPPLWLDEGWAGYYGWQLARAQRDGREEWIRKQPPEPEVEPFSLDELSARERYPALPAEAQMFYRESEEVIRALEEEVGRTAMARFLEMAARQPLPVSRLLVERWGWHEQKVRDFELRVQQRCRMPRILR
jgi:hypothetical protein